jgi:predicted NodU family carbamoyl transferase
VLSERAADLVTVDGDVRSPLVLARPRSGASRDARVTLRADAENHRALHAVLRALDAAGRQPVVTMRPLAREGRAVACTPRDAWDAFLESDADVCVMERYLVARP